jgi:competence protein ComEC
MEVGFQLSYLAVIGIIYLHPRIYALLYFPQKVYDHLWQITCVSIAAQIATFPLGVLYFHQFPTYFLLSNLLVIPAAFLILYIGVSYCVLSWIPGLGYVLGKALAWSIWLLNISVAWVESLPGSLLQGLDIGILETWLIYFFLMSLIFFWFYHSRKAMMWAAGSLTLIMLIQVQEIYEVKRFDHLVVYDVRGQTAFNLVGEKQNILFCDSALAQSKDRQQFHLQNNWNKLNACPPEFITSGRSNHLEYLTDECFRFRGKTFIHVNDKAMLKQWQGEAIPMDYLWISWHRGLDPEAIFGKIQAKQVILDGTVRGKTIARIKKALPPGIPIHAVSEDGYYMKTL